MQLAVSRVSTENDGLRKTISELREKLEQSQHKIQDEVQRSLSKSSLELNKLSTVASLRDELELLEITKQEAVQKLYLHKATN